MKAKYFKLKVLELDDETEVTGRLAIELSKPDWIKGENIWTSPDYDEDIDEDFQIESFSNAYIRLFGEKRNRKNAIEFYQGFDGIYERYSNGIVVYMSAYDFRILRDPTFKES